MRGINKAIIVGNVGQYPKSSITQSGNAILNFPVVTSEKWRDKNTGEQSERTEWHRVSVFGKLAEIIEPMIVKGSLVYIEGKIKTRKWQDQSGQDKYTTEIVADSVQMLGGKQERDRSTEKMEAYKNKEPSGDFNDEIPF